MNYFIKRGIQVAAPYALCAALVGDAVLAQTGWDGRWSSHAATVKQQAAISDPAPSPTAGLNNWAWD